MEEGLACKKPTPVIRSGRKEYRIAREEPIASIPLIRVVERIGFDVEPAAVPVRVHSPQHTCAPYRPWHHPLNTLGIESRLGHQSPPAWRTDSIYLFEYSASALAESVLIAILKYRTSEALRAEHARRVPVILAYEYNKRTLLHSANFFAKFQRVPVSKRSSV